MKTIFSALVILLFCVAAVWLSAQPTAIYTAINNNFGVVSTLHSTNTIVSHPTNTVWVLTGKKVYCGDVKEGTFQLTCNFVGKEGYSNSAGNLVFGLTRTTRADPVIAGNTNDWETAAQVLMTFALPLNCTNGPVTWTTNLNHDVLGGSRWIGILSETNTCLYVIATNMLATFDGK